MMYAIRSYYGFGSSEFPCSFSYFFHWIEELPVFLQNIPIGHSSDIIADHPFFPLEFQARITSYNVCYTKLLRNQVQQAVISIIKNSDSIIIFGPGETKKKFFNFLQKSQAQKNKIQVVEGIDSGGEDGIYSFTKSSSMREIMAESKLAKVSSIIENIMIMANKKSKKFTMGFEETFKANQFGAIESIVFSDKIIQTYDEKKIIDFLNDAESKGVKTFGVDSSTDIGLV